MQKIKLIGVQNSRYQQIKSNLDIALQRMRRFEEVEEVNDIDAMLNYQLNAIPAVLIDDVVIFDSGNMPSVEELIFLITHSSISSIKTTTIVVATDFSDHARNAFLYAQQMAEVTKSKIRVVHVVSPTVDITDFSGLDAATKSTKWYKNALLQIADFVEENSLIKVNGIVKTALDVKTQVVIGYPGEELVGVSEQEEVDFIVMGTTGKSGLLRKLIGSVSTYVARNAWVPVLLVPNRVNYKIPTNVGFATDNRRISEIVLKQFIKWTKQFDAFTHLINIQLDNTTAYKVRNAQIRKFKDMPNFAYKSIIIESDSIEYALNKYVENNEINLLAIVTSHRSLIEELLFKSTTKEMIINTEIPLLIMHHED